MGKAQSMSGKVVDKDSHEAIIGAVVYVGNSQKVAAITDINGRFSIDAANAGKSLKITYINSSLKFEIMAKQLYVASQRVL